MVLKQSMAVRGRGHFAAFVVSTLWGTALYGAALGLAAACTMAQTAQSASPAVQKTPASTPGGPVTVRVEPVIVGNLGDRVSGPATVYVDAPGAAKVEVYMRPVDQPYSGKPLDSPQLIGTDTDPSNGFSVAWAADEPYLYVEIFAVASYTVGDVATRSSFPMPILFDWRPTPSPTS